SVSGRLMRVMAAPSPVRASQRFGDRRDGQRDLFHARVVARGDLEAQQPYRHIELVTGEERVRHDEADVVADRVRADARSEGGPPGWPRRGYTNWAYRTGRPSGAYSTSTAKSKPPSALARSRNASATGFSSPASYRTVRVTPDAVAPRTVSPMSPPGCDWASASSCVAMASWSVSVNP